MFANQVSIKDLFSSNPGFQNGNRQDGSGDWEHENNSSGNSSSQQVYSGSQSQLEFPDSQDMYGSQPSSQKEGNTSSPSKFYQRYMAKGPFYNSREICQKTNQSTKTSFQQQLAANKTKAKERDERDLLNRILMSVKECSGEVQEVVAVVKGAIENGSSSNTSILAKALESIEDVLTKNKEEFTTALGIRDDTKEEIATLQEQVKERDRTIANLQKEKEALAEDNQSHFLHRLEKICNENNDKLKQSMEYVYESSQSELKKQALTRDDYQQQLLEHQEVLLKKNTASLQNMENRIGKEVHGSCRRILEEGERCRENRTREVTLLQQQHLNQVSQIVQTQISECISSQMSAMKEMMMQYWRQLQPDGSVKHDRQAIEEDVQQRYHKEVQELRRRFQQEVKDIMEPKSATPISTSQTLPVESNWWEKPTEKGRLYQTRGPTSVSDRDRRPPAFKASEEALVPQMSSPTVNVLDPAELCSEEMLTKNRATSDPALRNMFTSSMNTVFKSPMATIAKSWTSKMLFSKSSPSTIATVRPQQVQLSPDRPDEFRAQSNKKSNKKKRKPRPKVNKKVPKFEKEPLEVRTSGGYSLRRRDCSQAEDQGPDSPSIPPRAKRLNSAGKMVPEHSRNAPDLIVAEQTVRPRYPRHSTSPYATSVPRTYVSDVTKGEARTRRSYAEADVFDFDDETVSPLVRSSRVSTWDLSGQQSMTSDQRWEMAKTIQPRQQEIGYPSGGEHSFVDSAEMEDEEDSFERDSQMSSPSLSVTEFCIKRRIQQKKPTCQSIICSSATSIPEMSTAVYTTTSQTVIERNASYQVAASQSSTKKGKRRRSRKR